MKRESTGPILSTVFVDYDNIYLSLKRKSDEAAKRFAKDSGTWLQGIISGELITPTSSLSAGGERRIAMNRCYGNPVPRRNAHDNSTDMNSFPFVRHHFLRSGFEVIDCPPLTAQLKNSADIRIVMDIRDILTHDTFFDEFIILSGDADFTPVLHRLRAHARRTVVFANDHTAQPYTAISDGEIRESSLIALLLNNRLSGSEGSTRELSAPNAATPIIDVEEARRAILIEIVGHVRTAPQAVPLETLADRAIRMVGRDKTIGTNWGGYGTFRDLLLAGLPDDIHLSDTAPYTVFDGNRHISATGLLAPQLSAPPMPQMETRRSEQVPFAAQQAAADPQRAFQAAPAPRYAQHPLTQNPLTQAQAQPQTPPPLSPPMQARRAPEQSAPEARTPELRPQDYRVQNQAPPMMPQMREPAAAAPQGFPQGDARRDAPNRDMQRAAPQPAQAPQATAPRTADQATQIQHSIARIHEACQAPALAPAEYRVMFDVMAQEITANGLQGAQTLANVTQRAREFGLELKREDLRFILDVVSESDPWFEQGASANLFASRFRNYVVARCRSQGLSLSADELDLVEAWFSAPQQQQRAPSYAPAAAPPLQAPVHQQAAPMAPSAPPSGDRWWSLEEGRQHIAEQRAQGSYGTQDVEDEFPRIVRTRLRG